MEGISILHSLLVGLCPGPEPLCGPVTLRKALQGELTREAGSLSSLPPRSLLPSPPSSPISLVSSSQAQTRGKGHVAQEAQCSPIIPSFQRSRGSETAGNLFKATLPVYGGG